MKELKELLSEEEIGCILAWFKLALFWVRVSPGSSVWKAMEIKRFEDIEDW